MKIVEFTEQELEAQKQLNNIALRASGDGVAEVYLVLKRKLMAATDKPEAEAAQDGVA